MKIACEESPSQASVMKITCGFEIYVAVICDFRMLVVDWMFHLKPAAFVRASFKRNTLAIFNLL